MAFHLHRAKEMGQGCVWEVIRDTAKDQRGDQEVAEEVFWQAYPNRIRLRAIGFCIEGSLLP